MLATYESAGVRKYGEMRTNLDRKTVGECHLVKYLSSEYVAVDAMKLIDISLLTEK